MADYGIIAERGELGAAIPMTPPPPPPSPFPQPCPIPVPAAALIAEAEEFLAEYADDFRALAAVDCRRGRPTPQGFGDTYRHC